MGKKEFKGACIGITLLFFLCFEFIVQRAWIGYLTYDSRDKIIECMEIKEQRLKDACFIEYIEARNTKAESSVNNYLFLILFLFFVSSTRFFILKRRAKREKNANN